MNRALCLYYKKDLCAKTMQINRGQEMKYTQDQYTKMMLTSANRQPLAPCCATASKLARMRRHYGITRNCMPAPTRLTCWPSWLCTYPYPARRPLHADQAEALHRAVKNRRFHLLRCTGQGRSVLLCDSRSVSIDTDKRVVLRSTRKVSTTGWVDELDPECPSS